MQENKELKQDLASCLRNLKKSETRLGKAKKLLQESIQTVQTELAVFKQNVEGVQGVEDLKSANSQLVH